MEKGLSFLCESKKYSPKKEPFIIRYEINGEKYIQILKFLKHQTPHKTEKVSIIPAYNGKITVKEPLNNGYLTVKEPLLNVASSLAQDQEIGSRNRTSDQEIGPEGGQSKKQGSNHNDEKDQKIDGQNHNDEDEDILSGLLNKDISSNGKKNL